MSESTYIYPNYGSGNSGVTGPGHALPMATPQVMGNNEAVAHTAWEALSLTGCNCATGVRIKNYGTNAAYIMYAQQLPAAIDKGYMLEEGEEVFLEARDLNNVFARGVAGSATLTFIAS